MDVSHLEKLGMSLLEGKLYLKLLEYGSAPASTLAKSLSENRTSIYSLLNAMLKKGLVGFVRKNGVKYFSATDPKVLVNHLFDEAQQLKSFLPELLAMTNQYGQKPKITFYEGVEGIRQIGEILLEVPGSVREGFMGIDKSMIHGEIKEYFERDFIDRRIEKNITYRGIVAGFVPMGRAHPKSDSGQLRELKYIDSAALPLRIHIDIFPHNKVAIYSYNKQEMMGVIIEHESFYLTMRTVFKMAWAGVDLLG